MSRDSARLAWERYQATAGQPAEVQRAAREAFDREQLAAELQSVALPIRAEDAPTGALSHPFVYRARRR